MVTICYYLFMLYTFVPLPCKDPASNDPNVSWNHTVKMVPHHWNMWCWVPIGLHQATERRRRGARSESCHQLPSTSSCFFTDFHRQDMLGATWTATAHSPTTTTRSTVAGWRNMASNLDPNMAEEWRKSARATHCNPIKWRCSWENQQWKWRLHHQDFNIRWCNQQNMMNPII